MFKYFIKINIIINITANNMNTNNDKKSQVVSTGDWLITKILMQIPILNIILLLIWSFQKDQNYYKSNWAKATSS